MVKVRGLENGQSLEMLAEKNGKYLRPAETHFEKSTSPLSAARAHLDKETERGDHSPSVAGHETSHHGGRIPQPNLMIDIIAKPKGK